MAGYRNLNESLAEKMIRAIEAKKQTETSPTGVKDLGESGDVVWSGEDGTPVSVRDMRADIDDLLAEGVALSKKNTVSTSNPPASADGYPEDAWWTKVTSQDDTGVVGLWQVEDGAWVARSIPAGGLVAPFADIGLMSVAMLSAKIITSGFFRTAPSGKRFEITKNGFFGWDAANRLRSWVDDLSMGVLDGNGEVRFFADGGGARIAGEMVLGDQTDGSGKSGMKAGLVGYVDGAPVYGLKFTNSTTGDAFGPSIGWRGADKSLSLGSSSAPGDPRMRVTAKPKVIEIGDGSRRWGLLRVDANGTWVDGYRWTPKECTSIADGSLGGADDGQFRPGRYSIKFNHPELPTSQWGLLDVFLLDGTNNWLYLYRTDLGEHWSRTFANGAWTPWKRLDVETKTSGSVAWNGATGGSGTVQKHGNLVWLNIATVKAPNETVGTVPAGFRPLMDIGLVGLNENNGTPQKCWIGIDGKIHISNHVANQLVSMTVTYPAA